MTPPLPGAAPRGLAVADRSLLRALDQAWVAAARPARTLLQCRRGCTACCIGVFDITALDAWRLRRGLAVLQVERPGEAERIRGQAREQWAALAAGFPGHAATGILGDDEGARGRFFARFAALPCPALHPRAGTCTLYGARPFSCRTFGLPVRIGGTVLPPCELNFRGAGPEQIEAATLEPDPADREGALLAWLEEAGRGSGETVVAAALALA